MKKKELKKIAQQILVLEQMLETNDLSSKEKSNIQDKILALSSRITDIEDFFYIDEYIQENLKI